MYKHRMFLVGCFSWYITHPHKFVMDVYGEIKAFIQRGSRGYADIDLWGMNSYLEIVLPLMLRQLSGRHCGYPSHKGMTDKKWVKILNKIADGIEAVKKNEDKHLQAPYTDFYLKDLKKAEFKRKKALLLLVKYWGHLWD